MITLRNFYQLIGRNAETTLTNEKLDTVYYEGRMLDIPDTFDDYEVKGFSVSDDGDFLFKLEVTEDDEHAGNR